jgi:hypothetical protein
LIASMAGLSSSGSGSVPVCRQVDEAWPRDERHRAINRPPRRPGSGEGVVREGAAVGLGAAGVAHDPVSLTAFYEPVQFERPEKRADRRRETSVSVNGVLVAPSLMAGRPLKQSTEAYVHRVNVGHGANEQQLLVNPRVIAYHSGGQGASKGTPLAPQCSVLGSRQCPRKQFLPPVIGNGLVHELR